ncbi:MAG: hypothetical protein QM483_06030 [Desulfuromusa sp.]
MRINNSYILDQPKLPATNSGLSSVNQAGKQQRIQQAKDSYGKAAASSEIIDAEYVDSYSPDSNVSRLENQNINLALDPEGDPHSQKFETGQKISSPFSKYQMAPVDTPPPGTYLNIFA